MKNIYINLIIFLKISVLIFALTHCPQGFSQDLFALLDSVETPQTQYAQNTFKSVRLINGYTSETAGKDDLVFSISHRFQSINSGAYNLWGLDESTIRLGFEYGIGERLSIGIGRSSYEKTFDGFIKYKLFRQSTGNKKVPLSITWLSGTALKSLEWIDEDREYPFSARLYYVHELFIARKFSDKLSMQLVPVVVHRNMVPTKDEQNIVPAIGSGLNYTFNKWLSVSGEYYYLLPGKTSDLFKNSLSLGVELESGGGHVFQINISNSRGMTEKVFVPETTGKWFDGDIALGFNIIRVFHIKK